MKRAKPKRREIDEAKLPPTNITPLAEYLCPIHWIRKTYVAFCTGPAPQWKNITVRSGHGRSKFGAWRVYGVSDVGRVLPGGSFVRDMETSFEVLSINGQRCIPECPGSEKSTIDCNSRRDEILVRAYPRSGRTHQIRLHCQYLGIPIRGDVKYEGVYEFDGKRYEGHQLHAESLSFEHPMTAQPLSYSLLPLVGFLCSLSYSYDIIVISTGSFCCI
ncbi:hypothetical protein Leryth_017905 [Lithospermum erythrorhizon]|nr:hypothetical protein Leryth_017905 [Lithospermum erythrorhizon]